MNDQDQEIIDFFEKNIRGKSRAPIKIIQKMFTYHNEIFPNSTEFGVGCAPCVERVKKRLKKWIDEKTKNN